MGDLAAREFERLRLGQAGRRPRDRRAPAAGGPAFVGRVASHPAKIGVGKFLLVSPVTVLGAEVEGAAAALTVGGATIPAYLVGPGTPLAMDDVVCRWAASRWVVEFAGAVAPPAGGVALPQCFCTVPTTLTMTSGDPSCNYGMFQSCTLQYGPPPPALVAFGFTTDVYTSTESFTDPITGSSFFYYFACQYNQFFLTRVFPTSPFGSPYRDGYLYNWIVGGYGNTCSFSGSNANIPFALLIGTPFPGSDASCSVQITGAATQVPPGSGAPPTDPPPRGGPPA